MATIQCHDIIISDLLEAGADVDAQDPNGYTPLMLACLNDCADITNLLLQYDADVDVRDHEGSCPVFLFILTMPPLGVVTCRLGLAVHRLTMT